MFSKACEYAIRAVLFVAAQSQMGNRTSLKEISKEIGSPEAFTAKILQQLSKNNILKGIKGPYGGFEVGESEMNNIRLIDIVHIMDGDSLFKGCALGLENCNNEKPCPLHTEFMEIRNQIHQLLENTTLRNLSDEIVNGLTFLKR
ncbi:RrF2 family transcriptional regulator [Echinicola vietnamensis]|uniref:Rrf2 family protein, putative transcriptional regulator n=1 Tax=Echinicola vietnamensis (strain DSM 17526 / LMG 23754 / KMM 6221) TaxID=926556 RepID=L0G740_ECHVK|nr:Rrf2 family transcriptional regulator [Echinicola vietnamensis]AGA80670.1 rrf2 family protein, putative transcriptional regulator [Echinicola vietnamensis DSM 17526]